MLDEQKNAVIDTVETWNIKKHESKDQFYLRDMWHFVALMNYHTRRLISLFKAPNPYYWQCVAVLAEQAAMLTSPHATKVDMQLFPVSLIDGFPVRHARDLIEFFGTHYGSDFWEGLSELAVHAVTLTTRGAKVIADGVDRTNV